MKKELKSYKILDENFPPNPPIKDAKLYVLNQITEEVEVYITDMFGNPKPLKDDEGNSGGLYTFFSSDNSITISGTNNVDLILQSSLKSLIESSLQPNDNISELVNDVGYITQNNHISNVELTGTDLIFTGVENGFDGTIDLSSILEPTIIEDLDSTQIIDIGNIGSNSIEDGFNAFTFIGDNDPVQDQADGYVIVYTVRDGIAEKYLFIGEGGSYGTTGLETAIASDFVLLDDDFNYVNSNDVWRNISGTQSAVSYNERIRHAGNVILDNSLYVGGIITSKYGVAAIKLQVTGNYGVNLGVGNPNNGNITFNDFGQTTSVVFNGKTLNNSIFNRNYTLLSGSNAVTAKSIEISPTINFSGSTNSNYYGIHLDPNIVDLDGNEHYSILSENGKAWFKNTEFTINDYTLPILDGSNGQVITTDGNGNLTFEDNTSSADDQTASEVNITDISDYYTGTEVESALQEIGSDIVQLQSDLNNKQDTLISGTNIKTVNGNTLLGSGDINTIIGTSIENTSVTGTYNIDLTNSNYELTLTGNTTLGVTNTPVVGETVVVTLYITSSVAETLTIPSGWATYGDTYATDGTRNQLVLSVSNNTTSGLTYDLSISIPN